MDNCTESDAPRVNGRHGHDGQDFAHRTAYRQAHGEIPEGMVVRHTCDNPPCINPEHLLLGTRSENNIDAVVRNRLPYVILTGECVFEARQRHLSGETVEDLAAEYGVHPQTMRSALNGQTWRHIAMPEGRGLPVRPSRRSVAKPGPDVESSDSPHMTIAETALYMRKSKRHIEALVADGSLPSSKDGRRRTVHRNDADNYLRKCRQSGTTVGGAA